MGTEQEAGPGRRNSLLLQYVSAAPEPVALLFMPRLRVWLDGQKEISSTPRASAAGAAWRLGQVVRAILGNGGEKTGAYLIGLARQRLQE